MAFRCCLCVSPGRFLKKHTTARWNRPDSVCKHTTSPRLLRRRDAPGREDEEGTEDSPRSRRAGLGAGSQEKGGGSWAGEGGGEQGTTAAGPAAEQRCSADSEAPRGQTALVLYGTSCPSVRGPLSEPCPLHTSGYRGPRRQAERGCENEHRGTPRSRGEEGRREGEAAAGPARGT